MVSILEVATMSIHSAVDVVAFVSGGVYTETYHRAEDAASIANLFAFYGLLDTGPPAWARRHGRGQCGLDLEVSMGD